MYFDQILVHRNVFPVIPRHILEFFREEEESFWQLFFFLFTYACSLDDAYNTLDDSLREVEWANHDLAGDGLTYAKALEELQAIFVNFATSATRQLPFLRNPPRDTVISDVKVALYDETTFRIYIEFSEERSANLIPLATNLINKGHPHAERTPLINHRANPSVI